LSKLLQRQQWKKGDGGGSIADDGRKETTTFFPLPFIMTFYRNPN
jgi:hypothetical protein